MNLNLKALCAAALLALVAAPAASAGSLDNVRLNDTAVLSTNAIATSTTLCFVAVRDPAIAQVNTPALATFETSSRFVAYRVGCGGGGGGGGGLISCTLTYVGDVAGYSGAYANYFIWTPWGDFTVGDIAGESVTFGAGVAFATVDFILCVL